MKNNLSTTYLKKMPFLLVMSFNRKERELFINRYYSDMDDWLRNPKVN